MKSMMRLLCALLATLLTAASMVDALAAEDGYSGAYTYHYDYWSDIRQSPDVYRVLTVLDMDSLGLEKNLNKPEGLFVRDSEIYVCDTGNNRIVQIHRDKTSFAVVRVIDSFEGGTPQTFNAPCDVFVDEAHNLFIADTDNHRIVKLNQSLRLSALYTMPDDPSFAQSATFLPKKVVADARGNVYCLAQNVNKGLIKYSSDGRFSAFIGANKAKYSLYDYIWKAFLSTEAQRSQLADFVPTEYENIYIDYASFIYATNITFQPWDLLSDAAKPIRRLNTTGDDILIKNGHHPPVGDLVWDDGGSISGPSRMVDITALDNDIYIAFDKVRGRIFGYDSQGILLWVFGTTGNQNGAFIQPAAIEHMGYDLLAMDRSKCSITVFTPTEYGRMIYRATEAYADGQYETAAEYWRQVLTFNANYDPAFIGIGRSLMHQERYGTAMEYFKMAYDRQNYGKAFRLYRKIWVEDNIGTLTLIAASAVAVLLIAGVVRKIRREVKRL